MQNSTVCWRRPDYAAGMSDQGNYRRKSARVLLIDERNLFNRMIGQLYHCLQHGTRFDEAIAFPTATAAHAA